MKNIGQILRSRKNGKSKYTAINNDILQSKTLTAQEKSILVHLLSLPEDWIVYKGLIWKDMNMGREQFNRNWKGLVEKGYVVSVRMIDKESNLVVGWNHVVYEEPVIPDTRTDQTSDLLDFGQSENPSLNKVINEQSNNITKEIDREREKPKSVFTPPSLDEIKEYAQSRGDAAAAVDVNRFHDFYASKGWMVGKNKMKDWEAAFRTWESREKRESKPIISKNVANLNDD